ncbi:voltage-gated potassium channel [Thermomonospora echinospora]|uniref:Voltage-gated potassium channel n=1 Tax=Thermomonospora echinospora TaxID=1992 RepID=A0A1H5S1T7_9ACTN|nr:potassium channel family protein [Thermomonospora echinospora]SEF43731.1 voltage-gated potassium channel [Thermomonospora echinospora]
MFDEVSAREPRVLLPSAKVGPLRAVLHRLGIALALVLAVGTAVYLDRSGYRDIDGSMGLLDAFYYATVTMSTTGYGDIVPVSHVARLVNVVFITPARVLFLIVLIGTTLEVLAERTRTDWRLSRWRERMHDHIVVAGYGTKGRSAIRTLLGAGESPESIVVVDPDPAKIAEATGAGLAGVVGDATRSKVLLRAEADRAREIVIAAHRDDTAVLITLTARQLNPKVGIHAAVRESENAPLLLQSGADHVITSSEAAGRLLGITTTQPHVSEIMEDLLEQGTGMDLVEREVTAAETGGPIGAVAEPAIAVVRDGRMLPYSDPACARLIEGDRLVVVRAGRPRAAQGRALTGGRGRGSRPPAGGQR